MIRKTANKDLTSHNTFGMKVKCDRFIEYDSVADLIDIEFSTLPSPVKHIGGGSNLLFTGDFHGTVLHSAIKFIYELPSDDALYQSDDEVLVSVGAGILFDDFCRWAAERGLWGAENLSLIPGETGAAAVQNIGAYGAEISDIIRQVYCYDTVEEEFVHFGVEECGYGYRTSAFKSGKMKGRYIVTNVVLALTRTKNPRLDYGHIRTALSGITGIPAESLESSDALTPQVVRDAVISIRRSKLPDVEQIGSAGSFFKNPVVEEEVFRKIQKANADVPHYVTDGGVKIPAAWMIEQCGWKGRTQGNAGVYEKQPLVIVNATGSASPGEIIDLKNDITASVKERFGITLEPEVEII